MTIAQAFNEIAVANGGTASTSGTIAGAIDALNDALAGADQESAQTIEDAVRLLGQHIGSGAAYGNVVNIDFRVVGPAEDVYVNIYENEDADSPLFSMSGNNIFDTRGLWYCDITCPGDCRGNDLWLVLDGGGTEQFTDYTVEYSEVDHNTYFWFQVPNDEAVNTIAMT